MDYKIIYIIICFNTYILTSKCAKPRYLLEAHDLLEIHNYTHEYHQVTTEDGYILSLLRMKSETRSLDGADNGPPVLVVHGFGQSLADYVYKKGSLGCLLESNGYDVWLATIRGEGNTTHQTLLKNDSKYWDYSFHEHGIYDVTAIIDYILLKTSQDKLFYIGFSMGTTIFFVMASEKPEYNDKIRAMIALAPVAYLRNGQSPIIKLVVTYPDLYKIAKSFLKTPALVNIPLEIRRSAAEICVKNSSSYDNCVNIVMELIGPDYDQLDPSMIPLLYATFLEAASTKQILHYMQIGISDRFSKFDYESTKLNQMKYNRKSPPEYNISRITTPVFLHYSDNDYLVNIWGVNKLADQLPNLIGRNIVVNFNHLDFIFAKDVRALVYDKILETFKSF